MSLNHSVFTGRLTKDPEIKKTNSDKSVANITVACNRDYTNKEHPESDFIDVVLWEKSAEFVEKWFKKGDEITVEGRIQTRIYEDKDGGKRKVVEVVGERTYFGRKKGEGTTNNNIPDNTRNLDMPPDDEEDDELPF